MSMKILLSSLALVGVLGVFSFASAQTQVIFPVAELGNCADKMACKAYCADVANREDCQAFAEKHGFGPKRDIITARKAQLVSDGGPGGCAKGADEPLRACRAWCDVPANLQTCLSYAKDNRLITGPKLMRAEKVIEVLQSGEKLPEGCTSIKDCKIACQKPTDVAVARLCYDFAERAGILPPGAALQRVEKMMMKPGMPAQLNPQSPEIKEQMRQEFERRRQEEMRKMMEERVRQERLKEEAVRRARDREFIRPPGERQSVAPLVNLAASAALMMFGVQPTR